jgi:hypothetical protein
MSYDVEEFLMEKVLPVVMVVVFAVGLIGCPYLLYQDYQYQENVRMPEAYKAWIKHTGNPGNLTYQEWRHWTYRTYDSDE